MEVYQAIVKMGQDGGADGVLQVNFSFLANGMEAL